MRIVVLFLLAGCAAEKVAVVPCPPAAGATLVVASTDYSTGALATVDLETGCVSDRLSSRLGGDPIVVSTGDQVVVVLRGDGEVIRLYEPGSWREPSREIALPAGSNVHDVHIIGDLLFATPYERASLDIYDLVEGVWLSGVDLAPYADADGLPEADRLRRSDDGLLVGLQRLNRDEGWVPEDGLVLTIDVDALQVVGERTTGPSPKLFDDRVIIGVYGALDGALKTLQGEVVLRESEEGFDFSVYGARDDVALLAGSAFDGETRIRCHHQGWQAGPTLASWVSDIAMIGDGMAVLATRTGWHPDASAGLITIDVERCEEVGDPIGLTLEPYRLALIES